MIMLDLPIAEEVILLFVENRGGVIDPGTMIVLPDGLNLVRRFSLDHADLHDFPEFAGAGVGERHAVGDPCEHLKL